MTNLTVFIGATNSGKTTRATMHGLVILRGNKVKAEEFNSIKEEMLIIASEGIEKKKVIRCYKDIFGEPTDGKPEVEGGTSLEEGITRSLERSEGTYKDGVLVLEDYRLIRKYTTKGVLDERKIDFLKGFKDIIVTVETSNDGSTPDENQLAFAKYLDEVVAEGKSCYYKLGIGQDGVVTTSEWTA